MSSSTLFSSDFIFSVWIGIIPTASMLIASYALLNVDVSSVLEASFQNFCGGLILAAVAGELFPLMEPSEATSSRDSLLGISIGFVCGISVLNGVDVFIGAFENMDADFKLSNIGSYIINYITTSFKALFVSQPKGFRSLSTSSELVATGGESRGRSNIPCKIEMVIDGRKRSTLPWLNPDNLSHDVPPLSTHAGESYQASELLDLGNKHYKEIVGDISSKSVSQKNDWDQEGMHRATLAMAAPEHRMRIKEAFVNMYKEISILEDKSLTLIKTDSPSDAEALRYEKIEEEVDERIHKLQYKLDHARRLLQGSQSAIEAAVGHLHNKTDNWWGAPGKQEQLESALKVLKFIAFHLVCHIESDSDVTIAMIKEIHEHIDDMDKQLIDLHKVTEESSFKWRRLTKAMINPEKGSFVPMSLIIPVAINSFVDGFLMGITCVLSRKAGLILAFANCLEMAFLGMAVAMRAFKCTGSSAFVRHMSIVVPPLIMWVTTPLGAIVGVAAKANPVLFVSFVGFGVIALVFLVVNELLVSAREAMAGNELWWVTSLVFFGMYVEILMDHVIA